MKDILLKVVPLVWESQLAPAFIAISIYLTIYILNSILRPSGNSSITHNNSTVINNHSVSMNGSGTTIAVPIPSQPNKKTSAETLIPELLTQG